MYEGFVISWLAIHSNKLNCIFLYFFFSFGREIFPSNIFRIIFVWQFCIFCVSAEFQGITHGSHEFFLQLHIEKSAGEKFSFWHYLCTCYKIIFEDTFLNWMLSFNLEPPCSNPLWRSFTSEFVRWSPAERSGSCQRVCCGTPYRKHPKSR